MDGKEANNSGVTASALIINIFFGRTMKFILVGFLCGEKNVSVFHAIYSTSNYNSTHEL